MKSRAVWTFPTWTSSAAARNWCTSDPAIRRRGNPGPMRLKVRAISTSTRHSAANHRHVSDCTSLVLPYKDAPPHGAVSVSGLGAHRAYSAAEPRSEEHTSELQSRVDLVC